MYTLISKIKKWRDICDYSGNNAAVFYNILVGPEIMRGCIIITKKTYTYLSRKQYW